VISATDLYGRILGFLDWRFMKIVSLFDTAEHFGITVYMSTDEKIK
jgi:hypothetical protein